MMGYKICFYGEILLIITKLSISLGIWSTGTCSSFQVLLIASRAEGEGEPIQLVGHNINNVLCKCHSCVKLKYDWSFN